MKLRDVYIENEKVLADSGNLVVELAVVDPISEIHLRFKAKNGGSYNRSSPIARCVSKIEVVDGANVIYSLDGMMAQAMTLYQTGKVPSMQRQEGPSENQEDHVIIRFGRYLWDQLFALVPVKFRNLQIKVSWNLATVNTVGATGFLSGTGRLSIVARIMEGLEAEPVGFFMGKEHYDWTTVGSGDERIALPADYPYLLFLLRAYEANTKLYSSITNLKLSLDQDKDIPFDMTSWDFLKMMENEFGKIILDSHIHRDTEENIQTWLAVGETGILIPETDPSDPTTFRAIANVYGIDSGHLNLVQVSHAGADIAAGIHQLIVVGQGLHHTFAYPFGRIEDPSTYLNAPEHGDIKAVISQGDAGAAATVALLQAKTYA